MSKIGPKLSRSVSRLSLIGTMAMLGGCNMVVMNPTGDIALQQRNLILLATGVMLLIVVPVIALTILFAWRYRRGNENKVYDPGFTHSTALELVIWSCPLLIILTLGTVTWTSTHLLDPFRPLDRIAPGRPIPPGTEPLDVEVVALDWKWLFIYPKQGIATVNELAVPVDVPVRFSITSSNQFNTFYAPTMAGMIYAMPGMRSMLHAVLNKPGDSWGYSGNYTGEGYSDMRFRLHGLAQGDFDRWVAGVKASGPKTLAPADYLQLEKPSAKAPVMHFGTVTPGLFQHVVEQCVAPGVPCVSAMPRMAAPSKPAASGAVASASLPSGHAIVRSAHDREGRPGALTAMLPPPAAAASRDARI